MRVRTAKVIRSATVGFALGFIIACLTIIMAKPLPSAGVMIGQGLGAIVGATLIGAAVGYFRSQAVPADAMEPPLALWRKTLLGISAALLIVAIAGILYLMTRSRPPLPPVPQVEAPALPRSHFGPKAQPTPTGIPTPPSSQIGPAAPSNTTGH
ncbi:hypothetical protein [Sphingomonas sp. DT-204]|uniref:hypothetical protein n=1 Tax=Sphingomonas sp. DT-204 TaxID=3396166 RepID=UPI003F1CB5BC